MGGFVKRGGYVVMTPTGQYVSRKSIDQRTLQQIADLLGIQKPKDKAKLETESIKTIIIYAPTRKS